MRGREEGSQTEREGVVTHVTEEGSQTEREGVREEGESVCRGRQRAKAFGLLNLNPKSFGMRDSGLGFKVSG